MDVVAVFAAQVDDLTAGDEAAELDDVAPLVDELLDEDVSRVETWARTAIRALPTPLRPDRHFELQRRRALLTRIAAEAAARLDRPDELLDLLLTDWRDRGESPVRYVEHLVRFGRDDMAAVVARYALSKPNCRDRARVEVALESIGSPPDGWQEAVLTFAAAPSLDAWEQLMQFTPDDESYHRTRNTLQMLIDLGVDGDILFQCATRYGTTPDAIELVEHGRVAPETIIQRGQDGPAQARGLWLGLAARAALIRGDQFRGVRLLKEAVETADPSFPPLMEVWAVRELADDDLNEMLDKVGIPR